MRDAEDRPCLSIEGSRVDAEVNAEGVFAVRIRPAGGMPVAVYVDEALVAGSEVDWQPSGRHRRRPDHQ